jgi:ankyrin repeat protein
VPEKKEKFELDDLHFYAQEGEVQRVKELLEAGFNVNQFDELGKTALHYAAEAENIEIIQILLDAGADVNAYNESVAGNTPLRDVAGSCSLEVAKILIEAGADPTIPGWMQTTALHHAEQRKKPEGRKVYELLLKTARK